MLLAVAQHRFAVECRPHAHLPPAAHHRPPQVLTARLATVFASLKEMPAIRFRAAAPPGEEFPPGLESRLLVAQRIAVELHERLAGLQVGGRAGGA